MKGNTNIQVNGNVYGGIHVNGGGPSVACLPPTRPPTGDRAAIDFLWIVCKGLGLLAVGGFALIGALGLLAALLVVVGGVLGLALSWWLFCRICTGALLIERACGGSAWRLVLVPDIANGVRALASGDRVNEIETTEMTRYVE